MAFGARILADSISPDGVRLTTFEVTFPRIVLAEFNTHRMFSRNSASSRAIPVEKLIKRVETDPYIPASWGQNQKGMQAGEPVDAETAARAENVWLAARNNAVFQARNLLTLGIHKQLTNRLLEPFLWHTVICTASEWDNFFHLRNNPMAHPDIATPAAMMQELYEELEPEPIDYGEWHLPLIGPEDYDAAFEAGLAEDGGDAALQQLMVMVSAARCARVSYLTHDGKRDLRADIELHDKLLTSGHMSPFEHVARPLEAADFNDDAIPLLTPQCPGDPVPIPLNRDTYCGNFRGWVPYRKTIPHEADILGARDA